MSVAEQAVGGKRVRLSVEPSVGQSYAIHSEVFLDEEGHEFIIVKCHFQARAPSARLWVVELKNEPGDEDAPWTMHFLAEGEMEVDVLTGIGVVFQQPVLQYRFKDVVQREPLFLHNEYKLGPTWVDFYKGTRKVARVYTYYYRKGLDLMGNVSPSEKELLWVHAEEDAEESDKSGASDEEP
jgi:hypothetical protein